MNRYTFTHSLVALLLLTSPVLAGDPQFAEQSPEDRQAAMLTGTFHVIWGDPPADSGLPPSHRYKLFDNVGITWELLLDEAILYEAGGLMLLNGRRVAVKGQVTPADHQTMSVDTIVRETDDDSLDSPEDGPTGSQPYVWILARFADFSDTPESPEWFEGQALYDDNSIDDLWREVSYDIINLNGSRVVGWYTLPQDREYYLYDIDPNNPGDEFDIDRATTDCLALADPDVNFPDYIGINMIFNASIGCCAWGGAGPIEIDGQTKVYGLTWMPPWAWREQGVLGHEMGHAFGLPHSSGPYGDVYDSQWDVMSASFGTGVVDDPVYGRLGVHTIGYHKDMLDWIPYFQSYEQGSTPEVARITLHDLAVPAPAGRFHVIHLPWWSSDPTQSYTLETRRLTGYDANLPGTGVVIHSVDPARPSPALVYDADGDGDCNDEGARWDPGEAFVDISNQVVVFVESAGADHTVVTFTNAARNDVYVDDDASGYKDGSSSYPWNLIDQGHGAVYPNGNVHIRPGSYPETLTLRKAATLRRWGSTGVVVIGK